MPDGRFFSLPSQVDLMLHSDQGWQYQMAQYKKILEKKNIKQSMSRRGNCLDNAVVENFFGTLKSELYYLKKYRSVKELRKDIEGYIQYCNTERISLALNGMGPIKYRAHHQLLNICLTVQLLGFSPFRAGFLRGLNPNLEVWIFICKEN